MCAGMGEQLIVHEDFVDFGRDSCYNLTVSPCHLTGSGSSDGATMYQSEAYAPGEGGAGMADEKIAVQDASEVDPNLLRMLDRGLEDIEAGRTLPHDEAMAEVRRIRDARRFARSNTGAASNA